MTNAEGILPPALQVIRTQIDKRTVSYLEVLYETVRQTVRQ